MNYSREVGEPFATVLIRFAEKFEAMVTLGIANSRMKDFFDVLTLARRFSFDGVTLARAIRATFERRATVLPSVPPIALTPRFSTDPAKVAQWAAFLRRIVPGLEDQPDLPTVVAAIAAFVWPVTDRGGPLLDRSWPPAGPWHARE